MAEDIVANWNGVKELAVGLGLAGLALLDKGVVTHDQHNDLLKPALNLADAIAWSREGWENLSGLMPTDINMEFRLEDSDGKEITFPVRLVCNTTYY